jgi:hypothetical protein
MAEKAEVSQVGAYAVNQQDSGVAASQVGAYTVYGQQAGVAVSQVGVYVVFTISAASTTRLLPALGVGN